MSSWEVVPKHFSLQIITPPGIKRLMSPREADVESTPRSILLTVLLAIGFRIEDKNLFDRGKAR